MQSAVKIIQLNINKGFSALRVRFPWSKEFDVVDLISGYFARSNLFWNLNGLFLTILVVFVLEFFPQSYIFIPNPLAVLQLLVVYSALIGGMEVGFESAAVIWLYLTIRLSTPGHLFYYTSDNLERLIVASLTLPGITILSGILKKRSDLLFEEKLKLNNSQSLTKELQNSTRQYQLLFEKNPNPAYVLDQRTMKFIEVNDATVSFYGYSREDFKNMKLTQLRLKEDLPAMMDFYKQEVATGNKDAIKSRVWRHKKKNGQIVFVEVSWSPITFRNRKAFLVLIRDVTEHKRLDDLKSQFLSVASHEIKTPLTTAKLLTQGLMMRLSSRTDHVKEARDLQMIDNELSRLTRMVNDVTDISRIETGKMTLRLEEGDLGFLIRDVIKKMQLLHPNHRIVTSRLQQIKVVCDADRIEQVLINLINNAVRHSNPGAKVNISMKKAAGKAVVEVNDQGVGIPAEKLPFIFDRFYQGNNTDNGGFGLGLYISQEIIRRHHGRIWVKSEVGKGSTFYFTLPLAK